MKKDFRIYSVDGKRLFIHRCASMKHCLEIAVERGVCLHRAYLRGALLGGLDLRGIQLSEADLSHASLCDCDLRGANLSKCNLYHTGMHWARTDGADFTGSNLCDARMFSYERKKLIHKFPELFK